MKNIKSFKLFEAKEEHYHYYVFIEWEHGDADENGLQRYPFKNEDDMDDFLHFIYDVRNFIPKSGYAKAGHFSDGHYERQRNWIEKIDKKYDNRFSSLVPSDVRYRDNTRHGGYTPAVNAIWVEEDGNILNIIWEKALKTNIIDLPKIGVFNQWMKIINVRNVMVRAGLRIKKGKKKNVLFVKESLIIVR